MVQHRTATAVVGGAFMLLNGSAAVGLFCYGFSVFTLSDRQVVASPLFHAAEIALALIVHTFHVLMGSVFWKLRLMDQRADLLASIQRSVTAVTLLQLGMMAINGYFNAFMWNKAPFFGTLLLPSLLSIFFMYRFWSIDILEERRQMLRGALMLLSTSLCVLVVDTTAKWNVRRDLLETGSPALIVKGMDDNDFSIVASFAVLVCLAKVYYTLFVSPASSDKRPATTSNRQTTVTSATRPGQGTDGEEEADAERDDEVLPRKMLESLHLWILVAAFFSLLGPPITPLLLSSAVMMGATIKPKVWDGKGDIFYKLGVGQRRIDTDY